MNICQRPKDKKMPILQGNIGDKTVITLRDTGCSGAVVKKEFVKENQYTGKNGYMLLVDNSLRKAPIAKFLSTLHFILEKLRLFAYPMRFMTS